MPAIVLCLAPCSHWKFEIETERNRPDFISYFGIAYIHHIFFPLLTLLETYISFASKTTGTGDLIAV